MRDLLDKVNEVPGVTGSMVVTRDGIMVMSALRPEMSEDTIAALSSTLFLGVQRGLPEQFRNATGEEMELSAGEGKLVFSDLGNSYLVVVTQPNLQLDTDLVEVRSVARKLRDRCRIATD